MQTDRRILSDLADISLHCPNTITTKKSSPPPFAEFYIRYRKHSKRRVERSADKCGRN